MYMFGGAPYVPSEAETLPWTRESTVCGTFGSEMLKGLSRVAPLYRRSTDSARSFLLAASSCPCRARDAREYTI